MYTASALRSLTTDLYEHGRVVSRRVLNEQGYDSRAVRAQVEARRWQVLGQAVLLTNARPTPWQRRRLYLLNCGPHAMLTSFTAAEEWGLRRWEREEVHVIAPAGTRRPRLRGLVLHRTTTWSAVSGDQRRGLQVPEQALVLAASSFTSPRSAVGLLAAGVQQRVANSARLRDVVENSVRIRHRRALLAALGDISQGADALSEIDFVALCRRHGLPAPRQQAVRVEPNGRRRYLDAEWELPGGGILAVEIDGAHHVEVAQWQADQLRQNEIVLGGTVVLRFPSTMIRLEPDAVADQLRRILKPRP